MAQERPELTELAAADHGVMATNNFTNMLIENPDTVLRRKGWNWEIYNELLRDDQVKSVFQQRRTGLTSVSWAVEPYSEAAPDVAAADFMREQLEKLNWDHITDQMAYGTFYGFAVAEAMWGLEGGKVTLEDIKVRDRSRFRFNETNDLYLIHSQAPQGIKMPENKFWTYNCGSSHGDNPYGLGLAHSLYWPVFFKRSDIKYWMIFLEKFGMPTTAIRLPEGQMTDANQIIKAKQALNAIQADSGVVIPDGMAIELIEAQRSGTASYEGMLDKMDAAIAKVILSQTMTTDNGGSLAQAKVHENVSTAVIDSDADLINESFRSSIATWLTTWNFPNANPPVITRNTEPEEDLNERAERDGKIYALGYDPSEEYIEETYGPGWVKREAQAVPPGLLNTGQGAMPAEFAEVSPLLLKRARHREDQESLAQAAEFLATKYADVYGKRVAQLQSFLEDSDDIETFNKHLINMMEEVAPQEAVEAVNKANFFSRLMGLMRGQSS